MYAIRDKFKSQEKLIPNENELYRWWATEASYELTWKEFIERVNAGETVQLIWYSARLYKPTGESPSKKEVVCTHPKKYKNVLSKTLIFWVCPDCKKDLGDG